MDDLEQAGHDAIEKAVEQVKGPVIVIEMLKQFGDILHSTMVVRHVRKTNPHANIVWAIMEPYVEAFSAFDSNCLGPHSIAPLPSIPYPADGPYRVAWVTKARTLPSVVRAFGCGVHPWGWKSGSIVDAVLYNAEISTLAVERRPFFPIYHEDLAFANRFIDHHKLQRGYIALEYLSYSLQNDNLNLFWFSQLASRLHLPVVALAAKHEPLPNNVIDGRGTTFRQAKALIALSKCFIGRGSGLSVLAAAYGCEQPVVELIDFPLSMPGIGYRTTGNRHRNAAGASIDEIQKLVREMVGISNWNSERYKRTKRKRTKRPEHA